MASSERNYARIMSRLLDKVDPQGDGCWLWTGSQNARGYGTTNERPWRSAHRLFYELLVGPIPEGLDLDHLCSVRHCVNPAHLEPVTHAENIRRGSQATKTHCIHGHEFTPENTYRQPNGRRKCRACQKRIAQRRKAGEVRGEHGRYSTYNNWRCRCDACSAAAAEKRKDRAA